MSYNPLNVAQNIKNMTTWPERDLYYRLFGWFFLILVVPVLVIIGLTWARQPRYVRVAAGIVTPALLVTGFLFSSVWESRIFTPVRAAADSRAALRVVSGAAARVAL